jgi:23S rRNA maturation mini-RNase III
MARASPAAEKLALLWMMKPGTTNAAANLLKRNKNASSTKQRKSADDRFIPLRVGETGGGLTCCI